MNMTRKSFLAAAAASLAVSLRADDADTARRKEKYPVWPPPVVDPNDPTVDSEPVLIAPTTDSVGVVWAVGTWCAGGVEVSLSPEMKDSWYVPCGGPGRVQCDDRVLACRLRRLKPATRYYYRTVTIRFTFAKNYLHENPQTVKGKVHSFVTHGGTAEPTFAVLNDTHEKWEAIAKTLERTKGDDLLFWNGDMINGPEWRELVVHAVLRPDAPVPADYAADRPLNFVVGNHERYGTWSTNHLHEILMPYPASTRAPEFEELERNYAFRQGSVAFIILETGADKKDDDPRLGVGEAFSPYRKLQRDWLAAQFKRPEIASAPFVVAFCHIPLVDRHCGKNNDMDWCEEAAKLWGPVFEKNHVQLVITGHTHSWRYDVPTTGRSWAELVGGGPGKGHEGTAGIPTAIRGRIENGQLKVTVTDGWRGTQVAEFTYAPRTTARS